MQTSNKRSVLHIVPTYLNGGVETFTSNLARIMLQYGWRSSAYFLCKRPDSGRVHIGPWLKTIWRDDGSLGALLAHTNFDVITCHVWDVSSVMKVVRRVGGAASVVVRCATTAVQYAIPPDVDAVVGVSRAAREALDCEPTCDVRVILNGVDLKTFSPGRPVEVPARRVLLWVGRSRDTCKNLAAFLTLLTHLEPTQYEFWIVDGEKDSAVSGIEQWTGWPIRILSGLSPQEMCEVYRQVAASSGCLVITSRAEGFGFATVEAMACGCPVVGSAVGGVLEIIRDGHNGLLFHLSSGAAQCAKIVRSVTEGPTRDRIVRGGLKTARERFSLTRTAEEYMALYRELVERNDGLRNRIPATIKRWAWATAYRTRECLYRDSGG